MKFSSIINWIGAKRNILILIIVAVGIRIWMMIWGLNGDLITQAEWGDWMYKNGTLGLYDWGKWYNEWPNHPPLISLWYKWAYDLHSIVSMLLSNLGNFIALHRLAPTKFLWLFDFNIWYGSAKFEGTPFLKGIVLTLKFLPIICDFLIAGLVYKVALGEKKTGWKYMAAYLLLPFSWYLSAAWGQTDQVGFLLLIAAFLSLGSKKWNWIAIILMAISVNMKPTGLILVPYFGWIWLRVAKDKIKSVLGIVVSLGLTWWTLSVFSDKNVIDFASGQLWQRLFWCKAHFSTVSAFNFWYIFHAKDLVEETTRYLGISALWWGYAIYGLINLVAMRLSWKISKASIVAGLVICSLGGWMFLTNMYERYVFAGIASILFLAIYREKYFKFFISLSLIYVLNMFNGWWFPNEIGWLRELFLWNSRIVTKILSLANLVIYGYLVKLIWRDFVGSKQLLLFWKKNNIVLYGICFLAAGSNRNFIYAFNLF